MFIFPEVHTDETPGQAFRRATVLLILILTSPFISPDVLLSCASEHDKRKGVIIQSPSKNADGAILVMRNEAKANDGRPGAVARRRKVKKAGSRRTNDTGCTRLGGICQPNRFVCQGRYLRDKCSGPKTRLCCMPGKGGSA